MMVARANVREGQRETGCVLQKCHGHGTVLWDFRLSTGWTQSRARLPSHADRPEDTRTAICSTTSAVSTSTSPNQTAQHHQRQHTNKVSNYKHTHIQQSARDYRYKKSNNKSSDKLLRSTFRTTWLRILKCSRKNPFMLHFMLRLDTQIPNSNRLFRDYIAESWSDMKWTAIYALTRLSKITG